MTPTTHRTRIRWGRVAGLAAAVAALVATFGDLWPGSSSSPMPSVSTAASPTRILKDKVKHALGKPDRETATGGWRGALGEADGAIPDDTSVFDDGVPGVANLDPALLRAVRQAAIDAGSVRFYVNSGWRSETYQEHLLEEAVAKYGSREEASRWVATPARSEHVSGHAVDIGHTDAASWLSAHGAAYGLCQIYDNEPWHFELRPDAASQGCPARYADAAHDPRMQR